jgi:hypothetical protein
MKVSSDNRRYTDSGKKHNKNVKKKVEVNH